MYYLFKLSSGAICEMGTLPKATVWLKGWEKGISVIIHHDGPKYYLILLMTTW